MALERLIHSTAFCCRHRSSQKQTEEWRAGPPHLQLNCHSGPCAWGTSGPARAGWWSRCRRGQRRSRCQTRQVPVRAGFQGCSWCGGPTSPDPQCGNTHTKPCQRRSIPSWEQEPGSGEMCFQCLATRAESEVTSNTFLKAWQTVVTYKRSLMMTWCGSVMVLLAAFTETAVSNSHYPSGSNTSCNTGGCSFRTIWQHF